MRHYMYGVEAECSGDVSPGLGRSTPCSRRTSDVYQKWRLAKRGTMLRGINIADGVGSVTSLNTIMI